MRGLFGGILLGIGILIVTTSGLCTGAVIISGLATMRFGDALSALPIPLIVGGLPFAVGVGLIFAGRALLRSPGNPTHVPDPADRDGGGTP